MPQQDYQMCSRDVISTDKRTTRYVYSAPRGILTEALEKKHALKFAQVQREIKRGGLKTTERERERVKGPETERQKQRQTKRDRASENERGKKRWIKANCAKGFLLPVESSCSPTSKDSLSVCDLDVFKQARYCGQQTHQTTEDRAVTHAPLQKSFTLFM